MHVPDGHKPSKEIEVQLQVTSVQIVWDPWLAERPGVHLPSGAFCEGEDMEGKGGG